MVSRVADWPIQRKLLVIILMALAMSIVLVMLGIFAYELSTYRGRLSQEMGNIGAFIAANSAPSLAFDDAETAQEILNTLDTSPAVADAALYTPDGRIFARYKRPGLRSSFIPRIPGRESLRFAGGRLELVRKVFKRGRWLGTLYLSADPVTVYRRLADYAGIFGVMSLAIGGGALFLQRLLRRLVSDPLLRLAGTAENIAGGDLAVRFPVASADELGQLAAAFNHMTSQLAQSYEVLKEREERLRRSETTLRLAIGATGLGTFDYYPGSGKLIWSDLAKSHFGLPPGAQVDYQVFLSGLHPQERARVVAALDDALKPGSDGVYSDEYRTIGIEDGRERWLVARGQVFFDRAGDAARLIGATLDITGRKETETELRRAKDELETRVRERTQELEQAYEKLHAETEERLAALQTLRQNERLLLQQSRLAAMGEMLGNIAHQWRQPLNNLGMILQELALEARLKEATAERVQHAVTDSMELILHMSHTIDDFRGFLQPEKEKTLFNVNGAVAATISLLEATLKTLDVELRVRETEQLYVMGHRNEFSQVIVNLVTNARDAFQERGTASPRLEIELFRQGERCVVTVTDNAGGIPEEILDKIFDPYFTTKGPDKGTGIGLFMSKSIIEKSMKGTLTVRNTGEGAQFRIEV